MPAVQPAELWQESGRWERFGRRCSRSRTGMSAISARSHARRSHHRHRPAGDPQLPAAAGALLPDPDQVPRRDPAALRRHAGARVHHEGRLFVPRRLRGPGARVPQHVRHLHADLRTPGPEVPRGGGRHRRHRRHRLARVPRAGRFRRGRDRLRPRSPDYAANIELAEALPPRVRGPHLPHRCPRSPRRASTASRRSAPS